MSFQTTPTGSEETILSDLQEAWSIFVGQWQILKILKSPDW